MNLSELHSSSKAGHGWGSWAVLAFLPLIGHSPQSFLAGRPAAYSALHCRPGMSECGGGGPLFLRPVSRAYTFVDLPEPWPVALGTQEDYTAL